MKRMALSLLVLAVVLAFSCPPVFGGGTARTEVEITNGEIFFPEGKIPSLKIKDLGLRAFPEGTPEEILAQQNKLQKGKVYGWNYAITEKSDTVYLVITEYDPATKTLKLFQIGTCQ